MLSADQIFSKNGHEFPVFSWESSQPEDLFDLKGLRRTLELFFLSTGFNVGIVAHPSMLPVFNIGGNDICEKFHRAVPASAMRCVEKYLSLAERHDAMGRKIQPCQNGMIEGAVPIFVNSKQMASILVGPVLFGKPDTPRFKKQAGTFGYDVDRYLQALKEVPIVREERFKNVISFLRELALMISESAAFKLKLNEERENLSREDFESLEIEKRYLDSQEMLGLLASEMPLIRQRERRIIGTELHDCIGQNLALARIKIAELMNLKSSKRVSEILKEVDRLTVKSIDGTKNMTFKLAVPLLYEVGLEPAVEWLIEYYKTNYGLECGIERDPELIPMGEDIRVLLYQSVRELLINILKHAESTRAMIRIRKNNGKVKIDIEDNGVGFDKSRERNGIGLFSLRERLAYIGGRFDVQSEPGKGSRFTLIVPVSASGKKGRAVHKQKKAAAPRKPGPNKLKMVAKPRRKKATGLTVE